MNKVRRIFGFRAIALVAFAAFAVFLATPDANAQGTRRKRKPLRTPVVTTVPTTGGDAQIVSRDSDFPVQDPYQVIKPAETRPDSPTFDAAENGRALDDIRNRIAGLESMKKGDPDEKQKRLLLNLDILSRAEQRSESLRKQLFDLMEKENTIKTRLDTIEINIRPEAIERDVAFAGSLRPEDLRATKKRQMEAERTNLQSMLGEIQKTKTVIDQNLQRSEAMVEKLRLRLDKEVDDDLAEEGSKP